MFDSFATDEWSATFTVRFATTYHCVYKFQLLDQHGMTIPLLYYPEYTTTTKDDVCTVSNIHRRRERQARGASPGCAGLSPPFIFGLSDKLDPNQRLTIVLVLLRVPCKIPVALLESIISRFSTATHQIEKRNVCDGS